MALFKYLKRETTTLIDKQTWDATAKFKFRQYFFMFGLGSNCIQSPPIFLAIRKIFSKTGILRLWSAWPGHQLSLYMLKPTTVFCNMPLVAPFMNARQIIINTGGSERLGARLSKGASFVTSNKNDTMFSIEKPLRYKEWGSSIWQGNSNNRN